MDVVLTSYNDNWDRVQGLDLFQHKYRELAICETEDRMWIVIENKADPYVVAEYATLEDAFLEWSHA